MTKSSYIGLLKDTYNYVGRHEMSVSAVEALDKILALAHPQREVAFVTWPFGALQESETVQVGSSVIH